ncbi:MAG: M20/M25/M40 family metallo-hydrolase [Desulfobacterales bacterium]
MQEIIDLTEELVQFKTMHSKPDEIRRCAEYIENYLDACGVVYRRLDFGNSPSIMVLPKRSYAPVLLMSHIDVVDAPDKLFRPVIKDRKLYGRGCLDDKYAVALSMVLLKKNMEKLQKQGKSQKDFPFGILITSDEEIGGFNGAKNTLGEVQTDFCIVLDGGSIDKIVVKEKGVAKVKLLSRVKANFGDKPWLEENAIEKLMDDVIKWRTYFVKSAPDHWHRAVTCVDIHTEKPHQGVPECAEAHLEIRYTETDDVERMFSKMQSELHSEIVVESVEPLFPSGKSEHLKLLLDISKNTRIGFEDGANDARFLSQSGIKGIIWGADGDRSRHTLEEHVDIDSIIKLYSFLDAFVKRSGSIERFS